MWYHIWANMCKWSNEVNSWRNNVILVTHGQTITQILRQDAKPDQQHALCFPKLDRASLSTLNGAPMLAHTLYKCVCVRFLYINVLLRRYWRSWTRLQMIMDETGSLLSDMKLCCLYSLCLQRSSSCCSRI